jgi:hypothetical protein
VKKLQIKLKKVKYLVNQKKQIKKKNKIRNNGA